MSYSVCCRVCLSSDNKLYTIKNIELQEVYEKLTSAKLYSGDGKPTAICFICCSQLIRCRQLAELSRKADEFLTNLVYNGIEVTEATVYKLNPGLLKNLSVTTTQYNECTPGNVLEKINQLKDESATDDESEVGKLVINEDYLEQNITDDYVTNTESLSKFACSQCDETFAKQAFLNLHMRTHTGQNLFACNDCGKQFSRASFLKTHKSTHSDVKLYNCHLCDKSFKANCNLQTHINKHFGEKPWSCSICNRRFTTKSSLKIHMPMHSETKPFACGRCSKTFLTRSNLKAHMDVHSGVKNYACDNCEKTYSTPYRLKVHLKTHAM